MSGFPFEILVFMAAAIFVHGVSERFGFSAILGYILSGVILGQRGLDMLWQTAYAGRIAEFGVLFLLFSIGLHLPMERIKSLRNEAIFLGMLEVFGVTVVLGLLFIMYDMQIYEAAVIGLSCSLASTAVVAQILTDRGDFGLKYGRISFGILIFQDLVVIICLALLSSTDNADRGIIYMMLPILKAIVIMSTVIIISRYALKPVYSWAAASGPEIFVSITLLNVFGIAALTQGIGLSMEFGAFIAGILLSASEYRHQIQADLRPVRGLLIGLYFITVGSSIDLNIMFKEWEAILAITFATMSAKILITILACKAKKIDLASAIKASVLIIAGGEFGFILLDNMMRLGVVSEIHKQVVFISIAIAISITPLLAYFGKIFADKYFAPNIQEDDIDEEGYSNHVIIAGFGRSGQIIGDILHSQMIPYVAIDINSNTVTDMISNGYHVFYGDAKRREIYRTLCIEHSKMVIVALDDENAAVRTAIMLKRNYNYANIFLNVYKPEWIKRLFDIGIRVVSPEILEPTLQLANMVLKELGVREEELQSCMHEWYGKLKMHKDE